MNEKDLERKIELAQMMDVLEEYRLIVVNPQSRGFIVPTPAIVLLYTIVANSVLELAIRLIKDRCYFKSWGEKPDRIDIMYTISALVVPIFEEVIAGKEVTLTLKEMEKRVKALTWLMETIYRTDKDFRELMNRSVELLAEIHMLMKQIGKPAVEVEIRGDK